MSFLTDYSFMKRVMVQRFGNPGLICQGNRNHHTIFPNSDCISLQSGSKLLKHEPRHRVGSCCHFSCNEFPDRLFSYNVTFRRGKEIFWLISTEVLESITQNFDCLLFLPENPSPLSINLLRNRLTNARMKRNSFYFIENRSIWLI